MYSNKYEINSDKKQGNRVIRPTCRGIIPKGEGAVLVEQQGRGDVVSHDARDIRRRREASDELATRLRRPSAHELLLQVMQVQEALGRFRNTNNLEQTKTVSNDEVYNRFGKVHNHGMSLST